MKLFSKIKHLKIKDTAVNLLTNAHYKLSGLSKKSKTIIGTTAGVVAVGLGGLGISKAVKNAPKMDKNNSSIIMEDTTESNKENVTQPSLNGETVTTPTEDKKVESTTEFLSDKLKDVEIKDNEDKKEEVTEKVNSDAKNITAVDENGNDISKEVANANGQEIVEKVEYSGNAVVVGDTAYETQEDANRAANTQTQNGNVVTDDGQQLYLGADGEYYLTQEDANNAGVVVYDNDTTTNVDVPAEESNDSFYYDEENGIRWASYDDYMLFMDPTYKIESDYVVEPDDVQVEFNDTVTSDEVEEVYYGPDGTPYNSLEAYNNAMKKQVEEANSVKATEEVEEIEVQEELTSPIVEKELAAPIVDNETEVEVKFEKKEDKKEEVKEEPKTEVKEETKTEVKEETKTEVKEEPTSSDILDELDNLEPITEGWLDEDGNWWTSEEDYLMVTGQYKEETSKTR